LAGHFDEFAFLPFLEGLGLNPRRELSDLNPGRLALEGLLDEIRRNDQSAEWRVLLAVTYVQTNVIAPVSESRDRLLRLFEEPCLAEYATRGRALSEEVVAAQNENPPDVELRPRRCLDLHLALVETDATLRPVPASNALTNYMLFV
jgi:hypothetical protein